MIFTGWYHLGVERIKKEADAPEGDEHHMDWNHFRSLLALKRKPTRA